MTGFHTAHGSHVSPNPTSLETFTRICSKQGEWVRCQWWNQVNPVAGGGRLCTLAFPPTIPTRTW